MLSLISAPCSVPMVLAHNSLCVCAFSCVFDFLLNLPEIIRRLCCSLPNRLFWYTMESIGCMAADRRKWLFPLLSIHGDIPGILHPLNTQDRVDKPSSELLQSHVVIPSHRQDFLLVSAEFHEVYDGPFLHLSKSF